MANAKRTKGSARNNIPEVASQAVPFCTLTEPEYDSIEFACEQIDGCAELLLAYRPELVSDNTALTAANIIKEKAASTKAAVRAALHRKAGK